MELSQAVYQTGVLPNGRFTKRAFYQTGLYQNGSLTLAGGEQALVTLHPSCLLRLPDELDRECEYAAFVGDLRLAVELIMAQKGTKRRGSVPDPPL